MRSGLLVVAMAAVMCVAAGLLLLGAIAGGMASGGLALATAATTLLLAAAAAAFSWRAMQRSTEMAAEFTRLARSIDAAIGDFSARSDRDKATLAELNAFVANELQAIKQRIATGSREAEPAGLPQPANVVPHPAARRGRQSAEMHPDGAAAEAALQRTMASGRAELSLQPIISATRGQAAGFEVHVHIASEDGQAVDLRRLKRAVPGVEPAEFERLMVVSAAEAARRRLGDASEAMPLHAAISEALLENTAELGIVLDLFSRYPLLTRSVVLSLPAEAVEGARYAGALLRLQELDVRLAAEGWSGSREGLDLLNRGGFRFLKLPADRLLDRTKSSRAAPGGVLLEMTAAAAMEIIATDVRSDEDAVALIDLGVDLMTGTRFSGPRRLKPESGNRPGRIARN